MNLGTLFILAIAGVGAFVLIEELTKPAAAKPAANPLAGLLLALPGTLHSTSAPAGPSNVNINAVAAPKGVYVSDLSLAPAQSNAAFAGNDDTDPGGELG